MPNRTAKFVSAIVACVVSGAALATLSPQPARAAEDCLAAPKTETPEGSHWYYRINRASKRHCWYLRQEGEQSAQPDPATSTAPVKPAASKAETSSRPTFADAHAELPAPTGIEPPRKQPTQPSMKSFPDAAAAATNDAVAAEPLPARSVVASRWPESAGTNSPLDPPPAAAVLAENLPSDPLAPAAAPLAAAEASSQGRPGSIAVLLGVLAGALALAGITASLVLRFGGARRPRRSALRLHRGVNWEHDGGIARPDQAAADVLPRRSVSPRDLDQPEDANERIAEFFAQLTRRAPN